MARSGRGLRTRRAFSCAAAAVCVLGTAPASEATAARKPRDAVEVAGRKVFHDALCVSCHTVQVAGITKDPPHIGPDLSTVAKRMDLAALDAWLRKGANRKGKTHTLQFTRTDDEWRALTTWLLHIGAKPR